MMVIISVLQMTQLFATCQISNHNVWESRIIIKYHAEVGGFC